MKKSIYVLALFITIFSIFSCCEENDQNNFADINSISAEELFAKLNQRQDSTKFFNDFENIYKTAKLQNVTNYLLPDSTVNKLLLAARITNNQTKSIFFNYNQIENLMFEAKKDYPTYNANNTFGLSIYFGEYTQPIIQEINKLYPNAQLPNSLIAKKTLILRPSILLKNNGKDSLMLLNATNGLSSLNVGDLCPTNCPKNGFYDKAGKVVNKRD